MFNPDAPIKTSSEDILNRKSFSESMAKVMLEYNSTEAFSIGLYGKWGSGKTSVINMILENIQTTIESDNSEDTVIIMSFNPWLCSDSKQMISQFFKQLSTKIKIRGQNLQKIASLIDTYSGLFELANLIPVSIVGGALSALGKFAGSKAKKYKRQKDSDLQDLKNKIIKTLTDEKIRFIISIDDIDRLSEQEIISIFQLVKSLADFPNTMYLLAFDYDVVTKALSKVQNGNGAEYLEKIVQFPLQLPSSEAEDVHSILFDKLNAIFEGVLPENWANNFWSVLLYDRTSEYFTSVRNVNRFANIFSFNYTLLKYETNILDLIGLTCLQVFEPALYSELPYYEDNLCGGESNVPFSNNDEEKNIESIFSKTSMNNKDAAHTVLKFMFPKLNRSNSSVFNHQRFFDNKAFLANKNIAHPKCFKRYFSLSLEKEAIPSSVIFYILYNANKEDVLAKLETLNHERKIDRFMEEANVSISNSDEHKPDIIRIELLLECIFIIWENLYTETEVKKFFKPSLLYRFQSLAEILVESVCGSERYNVLCKLFNNTETSLEAVSILLESLQISHNRFTEENANNSNQLISLEDVMKLEEIYIQRYLSELQDKTLLKHAKSLGMMQLAEKIKPELATNDNKKLLFDSNDFLVRIISTCMGHGNTISTVVKRIWEIDVAKIENFIDINNAKTRVDEIVKTKMFWELSPRFQEDVSAFLIHFENREKGQEYSITDIDEKNVKHKLDSLRQVFNEV